MVAQTDSTAPNLSSLAPEYSFDVHGVYFTILKTTVDTQPAVRNIALAGTYGTGKSSILRQVADEYSERVVELSLLTLGVQADPAAVVGETNPAATSTTNRIQKEIVKQLLYQQRPTTAPESRFRRISRFRWASELRIAGIAATIALVLATAIGLDVVVSPTLAITVSDRPHWLAVAALFLFIALLAGAITLLFRTIIRGRVGIERLSAGPATITLPPRSVSYFDEYLDEIIYFFEMNSKRDIVIIEDLDRFNDPNIFEALRSLNGLLNSAQQLDGRNIRFIYAVRDSVFEKLGRDATAPSTDEARAELARANRTKFFELIIPVVPFITHKNARDLMSDRLEKRGHTISKDLVDLAARHLADMRLIHNVINEYEVFKHRLLDVATPVPELDPDRLFAMILFKNAHMADFEKIRHANSSLDTLWDIWREFVRNNIESLRVENRTLRSDIARGDRASTYAKKIGEQVRSRIDALASAPGTGLTTSEIHYQGTTVLDAELQSLDFWRKFLQGGAPLTIEANPPGYSYGTQSMQLNSQVLEALLGERLDLENFDSSAGTGGDNTVEQNEADIALLQRLTWAKLAADTKYTYARNLPQKPLTFRAWIEEVLPSRMAADLVIHGYITSYFPLHVSSFYGKLIRPDAMTYVMRFMDNGLAEADYPLDADDVEAILWDQGTSVLSERSMFNIGILNHLLVSRPADAKTVVAQMANGDSAGAEFTDSYLESGNQKSQLVALLAPLLPGIYVHLVVTPALAPSERLMLIDTAILSRQPQVRYKASNELRSYIEQNYQDLPSLAADAAPDPATSVVRFISYVGAVVESLAGLSPHSIAAFRSTDSYAFTQENLELVTGSSDVSLDQLSIVDSNIFAYATASKDAYAQAFLESDSTQYTVASSKLLVEFLNAADEAEAGAVETVVTYAAPGCQVTELREVAPTTWPPLVRHRRAPMSYANVAAYIENHGEVDEDLAQSLMGATMISGAIDEDLADRVQMSLALVNSPASSLDASHRVTLAQSLDPGILQATQIAPRSGSLIGDLIAAELIPDDADAFTPRLMVDWDTQSHAIGVSRTFASILSPDTLDAAFIAPLLRDGKHSELHISVANLLPSYPSVPLDAYRAYAERALAGGYVLKARHINAARLGGVSPAVTVQLLAEFSEGISSDELRDILRTLGKPWSKVADPGFGVTVIPDSAEARTILAALQSAGVVSRYPMHGGNLRVSLRQK